jgi:hypothetical protein
MPCFLHHHTWNASPTPGTPKIQANVQRRPGPPERSAVTPKRSAHFESFLQTGVFSSKRPKRAYPHAADRTFYDEQLVAARARLEEGKWEGAWTEGRAMFFEEVVACEDEEVVTPEP